MVMSALIILPLLAFAGFATDFGSWYAQLSRMQRAGDAAALAGVVWLPDMSKATTVALDVAERNGYVDGQDGISIAVSSPGPGQLTVDIHDEAADQYFSQLFIDRLALDRSSTAEFVHPPRLGNPDNIFGNSSMAVGPGQPNIFPAINAPYTERKDGDPFATRCLDSTSYYACTSPNPQYNPAGYTLAVDIPAGVSSVDVEVLDAGYLDLADGGTEFDTDLLQGLVDPSTDPDPGIDAVFELRGTDNTPVTITDNPPLTPGDCGGANPTLRSRSDMAVGIDVWTPLCQLASPTPGVYPLSIRNSGVPGSPEVGHGSNAFSVRAVADGGSGPQPQVYAVDVMSVLASAELGTSNFYLAEIQEENAGRTLLVELFDPGDGTGRSDLELFGPGGAPWPCRRSVAGGGTVTLDPCRFQTADTAGVSLYDDQFVQLEFDLPIGYTCGTDCWWTIEYDFAVAGHRPHHLDRAHAG